MAGLYLHFWRVSSHSYSYLRELAGLTDRIVLVCDPGKLSRVIKLRFERLGMNSWYQWRIWGVCGLWRAGAWKVDDTLHGAFVPSLRVVYDTLSHASIPILRRSAIASTPAQLTQCSLPTSHIESRTKTHGGKGKKGRKGLAATEN